jgi:hypothetical protein
MARPPPEDPRVTDLRRYRKQRQEAARRPPPKPKAPRQGFLGSNPRAGMILALVAVVTLLLWGWPLIAKLL